MHDARPAERARLRCSLGSWRPGTSAQALRPCPPQTLRNAGESRARSPCRRASSRPQLRPSAPRHLGCRSCTRCATRTASSCRRSRRSRPSSGVTGCSSTNARCGDRSEPAASRTQCGRASIPPRYGYSFAARNAADRRLTGRNGLRCVCRSWSLRREPRAVCAVATPRGLAKRFGVAGPSSV
jgi:hypothetical protein